jgi:acetyl-CoA C-acetyltransferase
MSAPDPIVIVGAARTPMGAFQSDFASLAAHDLGGVAIRAALAALAAGEGLYFNK